MILQPRFDPEELLQLIEKHRVTHLHMVPIMFQRLLALPDAVKARYPAFRLQFQGLYENNHRAYWTLDVTEGQYVGGQTRLTATTAGNPAARRAPTAAFW